MEELSEPLENYVKEIYELEEIKGKAKVTDLIEAFHVSPGTISKAINRLEKMGLIQRKDGLKLTSEGRKIAERLIRSHRLSERLLTDMIGLDWIRSHEIAHRLEHIWPDDVLDVIDMKLDRPATCPHGHPIPGRKVELGKSMTNASLGKHRIIMIIREEEWILREAEKLGLLPGVEVVLLEVNETGVKIRLPDSEKEITLQPSLAKEVMVSD
ncbi:metal-dependent transcriptional regulator [Sulfuracidifex metallicus]|jgi:DtxR family Mn-dependent transcriptional regulator|uniref:MarR family transcriptional regulator n=1 Tax=Sulfuracidifex metallicus DSM 6482 = JCM 9184 TaxID=523847 RepID=A0A6A9QST1_SULME|nr:metal-dependent transcriptional regulator [Sulfuracidifex metallicus]MUN28212.1 MarR family transcriptional regulator [Sulfuracidifex metallicus DSM 6482 = JCM 9184]WOE51255.1 metal-dependent transcriptional regulator [Sulfuracidifex metallicus DSM 6482 = JCM 9184]